MQESKQEKGRRSHKTRNMRSSKLLQRQNSPTRLQRIFNVWYHTIVLFTRQIHERQLDQTQKIIARQSIFVEHLQHQFVFCRFDLNKNATIRNKTIGNLKHLHEKQILPPKQDWASETHELKFEQHATPNTHLFFRFGQHRIDSFVPVNRI